LSNTTFDKKYFQRITESSYKERMIYYNKWCSVTDLELEACELYSKAQNSHYRICEKEIGNGLCEKERKLLEEILMVRRKKLDLNFYWTDNYKKQLLELNDKIMNGFSMAYKEAEAQLHVLRERIKTGDSYLNGFNIEISLKPLILEPNEDEYYLEEKSKSIYYILYNEFPEILWTDWVGDEHDLDKLQTSKYELEGENFNDNEYLRDGDFSDSFICWGMYELFSINSIYKILSWYDILKINEIWVEVKVTHQHFIENIGKKTFWDEGIQSLSDNEAENIRQEYMCWLSKDMTGLPVELLVDEMNWWEKIGPFKRLKFQGNKEKLDYRKLYSMSIEENPRILVKDAQIDLTDEELQQVKDFISKNRKLLLKMANGKIRVADLVFERVHFKK